VLVPIGTALSGFLFSTNNMKTLLLISLLIAGSVLAQPQKPIGTGKMKPPCPNAKIVETEVKADYTEIEYLCDGISIEVGYDEKNNIIYTEREAKIPTGIQDKIKQKLDKRYEGWSFDESLLVEMPDTAFYKFELMKGGIEENVYFSLDGKYYKPHNIPVSETWTVKNLSSVNENAPYNFLKPDKIFELPEILREISGMAMISENEFFVVQDEVGAVFKFDIALEKITNMMRFGADGDYEDIAIDNNQVYILRSDGTIFSFDYVNFNGKVAQTVAPTNSTNIEGLFFDPEKKRLLMASKSEPIGGSGNIRVVHEMHGTELQKTKINLEFNVAEINKKLLKKYPGIISENYDFQFNPSAIAVHPKTGETYILSASNRLLAIYEKGGLNDVFPLPSEIFYKPEGLAFAENGDLYISSEGMKNGLVSGQILQFRERKAP
jgi:uncharacterized protein YjiK